MSVPAVLALTLATAACAGGSPGDASGPAPSSPGPTAFAAAPSSEASPSPAGTSAFPSPSLDAFRADDKKRYKACRDGACEVLVTEGTTFAIDPGVAGGMDTVTVTEVDGEGAGVDFDGPGIHIHLYRPAGTGSSYSNGLAFGVVAGQGDEAVIRLGE
ncbi:hypothetical protein [Myceligenerans halotolerans]